MNRKMIVGLTAGFILGLGAGATLPLWAAKSPEDSSRELLQEVRDLKKAVEHQTTVQEGISEKTGKISDSVKTLVDRGSFSK